MSKSVVISKLPSAGLGNKLFSWASGYVFSKINKREHIVTGLTKLHPGAILRGEKSSRFYVGYFKNERLFHFVFIKKIKVLKQEDADRKLDKDQIVVFSEIPHWSDMFHTIKNHRNSIVEGFWNSLTDKVKNRIAKHPKPEIGVHIRMGDFRVLNENEDFSKVGAVRTPLTYFVQVVNTLRAELKKDLKVTVFSDGTNQELEEVLNLPNTSRAEDDLDIVHLSVLSKSKIIVMSAGSTFSYWAGFLSNAVLINHYQHLHQPIRNDKFNETVYEGSIDVEHGEVDSTLRMALKNMD